MYIELFRQACVHVHEGSGCFLNNVMLLYQYIDYNYINFREISNYIPPNYYHITKYTTDSMQINLSQHW